MFPAGRTWVTSSSTCCVCVLVLDRGMQRSTQGCRQRIALCGFWSAASALRFLWGHLWRVWSAPCYTSKSQKVPSSHVARPMPPVPWTGTHPALSLPSLSEGLLCLRWALRNVPFLPPFPLSHSAPFKSVFTASWHESRSLRDHIFFTPCLKTPLHKNTQTVPRASILRRQSGKWGRRDCPVIWVTKMVVIWSLDVVFVPHHEWHGRWDINSAQRPHWYPNTGNCEILWQPQQRNTGRDYSWRHP